MLYNLKVKRQINTTISCIGDWIFEDKPLKLQSLEDHDRLLDDKSSLVDIIKNKVKDFTAIPTGTYVLEVYASPRFGQWMLHIKDVKGFGGILIHPLNEYTETEGCIGIGQASLKNFIGNSRLSYRKLLELLAPIMNFTTKNEAKNWTKIIYDPKKPSKNIVKITIERNY